MKIPTSLIDPEKDDHVQILKSADVSLEIYKYKFMDISTMSHITVDICKKHHPQIENVMHLLP